MSPMIGYPIPSDHIQHIHISHAIKRDWRDTVEVGGRRRDRAEIIQNALLMFEFFFKN